MFESRNPYAAWMNVAAAFAVGAALAWMAGTSARRLRRTPAPISDDIVRERVRARVGEIVSRPDAIEVTVENGVVRLAGEVPAEERDELLTQLLYMPGVMRLRNALGTV
jgi:osmotically-inducible protein OsmY